VRFAVRHGVDAAEVDEMWHFIEGALSLEKGYFEPIQYVEPFQHYSGERLKRGQILSEARLIDLYELALKKAT
jgi:hypothetical protein